MGVPATKDIAMLWHWRTGTTKMLMEMQKIFQRTKKMVPKNKGDTNDGSDDDSEKADGENRPQPGYFHVVASFILVVHGFTFLVPPDTESEDTDMMRTIGKWFGFDWDWMKYITPYAQGLASVFNISLGIVSWWTSKESERYDRLIQLRVFAFCLNILHAYITGPIIYQNDDLPLLAPGRIIGLFRLSYLTPGLMAAGVTEVIVEKDQFVEAKDDTKTLKNNTPPTTTKALTHQSKKIQMN